MAQALICGQDWLRPATATSKMNVEEKLEELEQLEKGLTTVIFHSLYLSIVKCSIISNIYIIVKCIYITDLEKTNLEDEMVFVTE